MMDIISMLADGAAAATENLDALRAGATNGSFTLGVAGAGAGIGVGLVGFAAAQAVGRNPGAFGQILTIGIIGYVLDRVMSVVEGRFKTA